jgi:hypothetical protein
MAQWFFKQFRNSISRYHGMLLITLKWKELAFARFLFSADLLWEMPSSLHGVTA